MSGAEAVKRRVCVIADAVDEPYAGVSTYARELVPRLVQVAPDLSFTFLHLKANSFFRDWHEIVIPLKRNNPVQVLWRKCVQVPAAVRKGRFALVHDLFHFPPFGFQDLACGKVVTIHDMTPVSHPVWHTRMTSGMHRLCLPRVLRRATRVIADSEATASEIARLYGRESGVCVVPLASKVQRTLPAESRDCAKPVLLCVGTLEPRKNHLTLIESFDRLCAAGRALALVLIGRRGWKARPIVERIARSPYREDIHHLEGVSDADLSAWYGRASVFVYPSLAEGFGLPVLEAMQMGCPVITSRCSSLPEVAGDAALFINPMDSDALVYQIGRVLDEPGLAQQLREAGWRRAQGFSWERTARETVAVYRELLAEREVG